MIGSIRARSGAAFVQSLAPQLFERYTDLLLAADDVARVQIATEGALPPHLHSDDTCEADENWIATLKSLAGDYLEMKAHDATIDRLEGLLGCDEQDALFHAYSGAWQDVGHASYFIGLMVGLRLALALESVDVGASATRIETPRQAVPA